MTRKSSSPPAGASACTARRSTSQPSWPDKGSVSRKSTTPFGSSALCTMISDTTTWSRKHCNPSTTRSARGCHPCLRVGHRGWVAVVGDRSEPVSAQNSLITWENTEIFALLGRFGEYMHQIHHPNQEVRQQFPKDRNSETAGNRNRRYVWVSRFKSPARNRLYLLISWRGLPVRAPFTIRCTTAVWSAIGAI